MRRDFVKFGIMKVFGFKMFVCGLILFLNLNIFAQNKTFILVRHAEKDTSAGASRTDPELTDEGKKRAARLFELVKNCRPEYIFSTTFKRTINTAAPSAESLIPNYRLQLQFYDYDELEDFAARLLNLKTRCVLVVGHNSTTPALANLLIKEEKYKPLADTEYNKAFIIKIKDAKTEDKVIEY